MVAGLPLSELDFPEGAAVALVVRGDELVPPRGSTVLRPGDEQRVYARMPIRRRGVTTIRFATADWDHELHYRCTPESSLGG